MKLYDNNLTKKVYLSSLSIGSTEDNSQLFCLLHNGYLGVLVHIKINLGGVVEEQVLSTA